VSVYVLELSMNSVNWRSRKAEHGSGARGEQGTKVWGSSREKHLSTACRFSIVSLTNVAVIALVVSAAPAVLFVAPTRAEIAIGISISAPIAPPMLPTYLQTPNRRNCSVGSAHATSAIRAHCPSSMI
jgi:hypothetical protein